MGFGNNALGDRESRNTFQSLSELSEVKLSFDILPHSCSFLSKAGGIKDTKYYEMLTCKEKKSN